VCDEEGRGDEQMNLEKLFNMQRELDAKIIKEKGLEDMDRLPYLILALQVELGECANEWRGFKYWSSDREPRTSKHTLKKEYKHLHITQTGAYEYQLRDEFGKVVFDDVTDHHHDHTNPLLEEYVDCLHFILSIGVQEGYDEEDDLGFINTHNILVFKNFEGVTHQFKDVFKYIAQFDDYHGDCEIYQEMFMSFVSLGEMLGFTWEQIEQAYMSKNAVNHQRQVNGY
jgi:dimeric dUTPase (all-alpha-NTP-PPase superfamily)